MGLELSRWCGVSGEPLAAKARAPGFDCWQRPSLLTHFHFSPRHVV